MTRALNEKGMYEMARMVGPDETTRELRQYVWRQSSFVGYANRDATVFLDKAGTQPADIRVYDPAAPTVVGAAIAGSRVLTDKQAQLPRFWFPDGVVTLYVIVNGLSRVWTVTADVDARIGVAVPSTASLWGSPTAGGQNIVAAHQIATLQRWLTWLDNNSAKGAITEIGFPGGLTNTSYAGQTILNWGPVAEAVLAILDGTDIPVAQWADPTGMFQTVAGAQGGTPTLTQAAVPLLRHRYAGPRAMQAGGAVGIATPTGFSNSNPYTGANWFPGDAWFKMIAASGLTHVRLSFRWETLQPTLGGALNGTELNRIQAAVALAGSYGLKVILDLHNYAEYITSTGPKKIGGGTVTQAHLVDVWTKLSTAFKGNATVYAYELMNEPTGLANAAAWETISQAVLTAIRNNADTTLILVPTYDFSAISRAPSLHPTGWITDTANNFRYNVHFYMSGSAVGGDAAYDLTWEQEKAALLYPGGYGYTPLGPEVPIARPAWMRQPQIGEMTTPRHNLGTPGALISKELKLTFFQAEFTEPITRIRYRVNTTGGTATLSRIGIFRANEDGSITLLAATDAADVSLFTTFGNFTKNLTTTWRKKAGLWYAIGALTVQTSGQMPVLAGMGPSFGWDTWPYSAMTIWDQNDLPSSAANNVLSANNAVYHAYHMLPAA